MQNYDNVTIEGFATRNPTMRETKTGKTVCTFSLAVNHYSKADSEPIVSFIDVETWEKVAKICGEHITKGKRIFVAGRLRQDRWEGKDGKTQSKIKIIGNEIRFLESLKDLNKSEEPAVSNV